MTDTNTGNGYDHSALDIPPMACSPLPRMPPITRKMDRTVLGHLRSGKSINRFQSDDLYRTAGLSAIISRLRKLGWGIYGTTKRNSQGEAYSDYAMLDHHQTIPESLLETFVSKSADANPARTNPNSIEAAQAESESLRVEIGELFSQMQSHDQESGSVPDEPISKPDVAQTVPTAATITVRPGPNGPEIQIVPPAGTDPAAFHSLTPAQIRYLFVNMQMFAE